MIRGFLKKHFDALKLKIKNVEQKFSYEEEVYSMALPEEKRVHTVTNYSDVFSPSSMAVPTTQYSVSFEVLEQRLMNKKLTEQKDRLDFNS